MELEADGEPISVTLIKPGAIATPYHEHDRNLMKYEARNPPPVYAPEVVADVVVRMAERPQRDVYVGGGGRLFALFGQFAPRMTDRAMEKTMFRLQERRDLPAEHGADNLYSPAGDGGRERGEYPEPVLERSLYTAVVTRPLAGLALSVAGLFALGLIVSRLS
jgi:hypothetical protein